MNDELLAIDEAAALLRMPVATLRHWRFYGTGPASFRMGRRVFYKRSELDRWIEKLSSPEAVGSVSA